MIDTTPYLGKATNPGGLPLGGYIVKELGRSIYGAETKLPSTPLDN